MSYTFKAGDTPGNVAVTLGGKWADWSTNYYKLPDGTVKKGSEIDPTKIPIGTTAYTPAEYEKGDAGGGTGGATTAPGFDSDAPVVDSEPVEVNGTTLPNGGKLVYIANPEGSDEKFLWYVVYEWQGVELAYEIGGPQDFYDTFGTWDIPSVGMDVSRMPNQAAFDELGLVQAGTVGEILGSTESIGSQIQREVNALGLEDLPAWMKSNKDTLVLLATATAEEWSSGRLWQELAKTSGFEARYGGIIDDYLAGGVPIGTAVTQIEADENALKAALLPFSPSKGSPLTAGIPNQETQYLQSLLKNGWTPGSVTQVLKQADVLRSDPTSFTQANLILQASGLGSIDEVGFINALAGFGDEDVVEALNTAAAATALANAGLEDVDIDLLMEVVDTSDRLLTTASFAALTQELATNIIRFGHEITDNKLGFTRDDLIAAAFGESNPNGKTPGEVINALSRFERDRQAAGSGFEQTTGFQDDQGRLRIAGLGSL